MKKYIKLYALLAMALFVGACEDELGNSFQPIQIVPGEEIQFGAVAGFETSTKDTRTIYGDINSARNLIEVNWVPGVDRIQIISPHTTGAEVAEYQVTSTNADQNNNGVDNKFEQYSKAKTLQRIGDAGLQWSNGESYEFYAMYPSHNQLQEVVTEVADVKNYGLKKAEDNGAPEGTMTGYLPVTQDPDPNNPVTSQNGVIKIHPDMRYAYMVAKEYYNVPESGAIEDEDDKIQLNFESLVTALEFELVVNEIGAQNDKTNSITIMALSLTSKKYDLCGKFCYTFPKGQNEAINEGEFKIDNESTSNYKSINMRFGDGIPVVENDVIKATFFVLPSAGVDDDATFDGNDLKLTVTYKVAGQPQFKTATIKTPVQPRKYTYFKNVKLPKVDANVNGSKWFNALSPDVFVSQVSIPVAANAFANKSYVTSLGDYNTQQTKNIETLWNLGVRGFEICVDWEPNENNSSTPKTFAADDEDIKKNHNLDNRYIIASEQATNVTFASQLDLLHEKMFETTTDEDGNETTAKTGEPLVLIVTFQPRAEGGSGYNPYYFLFNLMNSMETFCQRHGYKNVDEIFVQLNSTMTVKDLYGKIALIVRPCSDERWAYETFEFQRYYDGLILNTDYRPCYNPLTLLGINSVTNEENTGYVLSDVLATKIPEDLSDNMLFIKDWGMDSWDFWHRRFGEENYYYYASTATNMIKIQSASRTPVSQAKYEDVLLGKTSNSFEFDYYYDHGMHNGGTAYVQDMVRIANGTYNNSRTVNNTTYNVTWESSIDKKKIAIDGLFKKSVLTKNSSYSDNIYINNLSGYYIVEQGYDVSWYPAYYIPYNYDRNEVFPGNSKGGDYKACAKELTSYVYGILSGGTMASSGQLDEGPWGLVMMDYIGEVDNSTQLVDLIMMNNFRFPLAKENTNESQLVKVTLNDEKISPELNILVNWD